MALANKNARIIYAILAGKTDRFFARLAASPTQQNDKPALRRRPGVYGQEGVTMAA